MKPLPKKKKKWTAAEEQKAIKKVIEILRRFEALENLSLYQRSKELAPYFDRFGEAWLFNLMTADAGIKSPKANSYIELIKIFKVIPDERAWKAVGTLGMRAVSKVKSDAKRNAIIKTIHAQAKKVVAGVISRCDWRDILKDADEFLAAREGRCVSTPATTAVSIPGPSAKQPKPQHVPLPDPTDRLERNVALSALVALVDNPKIGLLINDYVPTGAKALVEKYRKEIAAGPVLMPVG